MKSSVPLAQKLDKMGYAIYATRGTSTKLWENGVEVETGNELVVQGCKFPEGLDKYDVNNYTQYGGEHYSCDLMYDKMVKFVEDNASSPFFVMWTTTVPHSAVQAPLDEVMQPALHGVSP